MLQCTCQQERDQADFVVWRESDMFIQKNSFNVSSITKALEKIPCFVKSYVFYQNWLVIGLHGQLDSISVVASEVVYDSLDGNSDDVDGTVSSTVTVTSDMPTSTQQVFDEEDLVLFGATVNKTHKKNWLVVINLAVVLLAKV